MTTTDSGRLGEAKVIAELTAQGYYPFVDMSGKCPIDIVAWKDGKVYTYQVKATQYQVGKSWLVQIKTVRPNRSTNVIKQFDNSSVDYLAIYIIPEDRVILMKASEITQKNQISVPTLGSSNPMAGEGATLEK